jgi:pilus assembly protein CpaC
MLAISGRDQVMLRVRIIEIQRNVIKQLGFNLQGVIDSAGSTVTQFGTNATFGINGSLLGGITSSVRGGTVASASPFCSNMQLRQTPTPANQGQCGAIQAFERVGLVRTLAEPNLTAVSGQSAHFLAGGEFPVPSGQDNAGNVTLEFKPFGVGLGFTPVVLSGGRISLQISTEVSELSTDNAFSLGGTNGAPTLVVPSLTVRRAETTVELPSGGAMMIAGLLQDRTRQNLDSLPGMMNLPVLGALFRSRDYQQGQTELVIIVTPYLVTATSPQNLQTPADGLQIANDAETVFLGRLNRAYHRSPEATAGRSYQGPIGYVVE